MLGGTRSRRQDGPHVDSGRVRDAGGDPGAILDDLPLLEALAYARNREYRGWDYGDGMSSRLLQAVPVNNRLLNLVVQETIKRSPVNLRPLFLVEQRRNFKGAALFAMANRTLQQLDVDGTAPSEGSVDFCDETRELLDWLVEQGAPEASGFGVGHPHQIQDLQGLADANEPDSVCTSYAVKALLRAADMDDRYARVARSAARFVRKDLDYRETDHGARITYSQNHHGEYYTLNAGALAGRMYADLYDYFGDDDFRRRARAILDHVAAKQAANGGWHYRDPPSASHLSMDTHHNGFIIESLMRYDAATGTDRYGESLADAMPFFEGLFDADGAPHFDENERYPRDAHAAAQGILVFTYAGNLERARRVIDWTVANLSDGEGRFFFREKRLYTHRVTLMRWCQAWLCFAMTEYLRAVDGESPIDAV